MERLVSKGVEVVAGISGFGRGSFWESGGRGGAKIPIAALSSDNPGLVLSDCPRGVARSGNIESDFGGSGYLLEDCVSFSLATGS